jgi:hypothetical protein
MVLSRPDYLLIFLLLAAIIVALVAVAIPAPQELPRLPQSDHAKKGHLGQAWTATTIASYMATSCQPRIFSCGDALHYYCPDPDHAGNLLGLLIGANQHIVITGFTARTTYWLDKVVGCHEMGY